jgi:hypothetical protein
MIVGCVSDPCAVPGTSVANVVRALVGDGLGYAAVLGAVEGAGIPLDWLIDGTAVDVPMLLSRLGSVKQFDWADLYLVSSRQDLSGFRYRRRAYADLLLKCDCLVRAIDSSYVYVFSEVRSIAEMASLAIECESLQYEDRIAFTYPD